MAAEYQVAVVVGCRGGGWGGRTHVLHAVVGRSLVTCVWKDQLLFLSERFPMVHRSFSLGLPGRGSGGGIMNVFRFHCNDQLKREGRRGRAAVGTQMR